MASALLVDLRSDTLTKPTAAMRDAMARADVGDDVFGEDPTVCALQRDVVAVVERARARGLAAHLDGARIWNASVATGVDVATLCAPFDTVSVCFSKGLGAPVGSALCGPRELIDGRARRLRKAWGGG